MNTREMKKVASSLLLIFFISFLCACTVVLMELLFSSCYTFQSQTKSSDYVLCKIKENSY
jgi:hypothetical protein